MVFDVRPTAVFSECRFQSLDILPIEPLRIVLCGIFVLKIQPLEPDASCALALHFSLCLNLEFLFLSTGQRHTEQSNVTIVAEQERNALLS